MNSCPANNYSKLLHDIYSSLPEGTYRYQFIVTDIIGHTYGSDYCFFEIREEEGERIVQIREISQPDP